MSLAFVFDTLLEASIRSLVIAGLVAAALAAFRVRPPATRHTAWTAVMAAMLLMPMASRWVPTIDLPVRLPQLPAPALVPDEAVATIPAASRTVELVSQQASAASTSVSAPAGSPAVTQRTPSSQPPVERQDWRQGTMVLWLVVASVMLLREVTGLWRVRRLTSQGTPSSIGDGTHEFDRVMSPVVTGVWRPRIMVPASWSEWKPEVRQLVLAHERAHVSRRDPLIAALARLNRAVFWFHPLAWWIERHVSVLAERACDEAVVRQCPDPRGYASLLVEMAQQVRRHGYRVAWQGIGIVSARQFEDRLDRVLSGPARELSRRSKVALATIVGLLVLAGLACGTQAAPLAEDPVVARDIADRAAAMARYDAAINMTLDDVAQLEAIVAKNPDDLVATERLLTFYQQRGQKLMGWDRTLAARRPHLLRIIAAHPESPLAYWPFSREADPAGYQKARVLWIDRLERDVSLDMLSNAARFFERSEKPMAEQVLRRAQTADPQGPTPRVVNAMYRAPWSTRLGELYAMAIVGSDGLSVHDRVKSPNLEQAHGAFAREARRKLDQSEDVKLLVGAAVYLTRTGGDAKMDFLPAALGLGYAEKALKLDPTSAAAKQIISAAAHNADWDKQLREYGKPAHTLDATAYSQLPDAAKLAYAIDFLYAGRLTLNPQSPDAAFESLRDRAEAMQMLVNQSEPSAVPPGLQASIHIAFGSVAFHRGDRGEAVRRLGLAGSTAPRVASIVNSQFFDYSTGAKLVFDLLDAGERESVAAFYDAIAKSLEGPDRTRYEDAAKAIRENRMPADYQRYKARTSLR